MLGIPVLNVMKTGTGDKILHAHVLENQRGHL